MGYGTYGSSQSLFGTSDPTMGADWDDDSPSSPIPEPSREDLEKRLEDKDANVRYNSAVSLAYRFQDRAAYPILEDALLNGEHPILEVLNALHKIDEDDALRRARELFTSDNLKYEGAAEFLFLKGDKLGFDYFISQQEVIEKDSHSVYDFEHGLLGSKEVHLAQFKRFRGIRVGPNLLTKLKDASNLDRYKLENAAARYMEVPDLDPKERLEFALSLYCITKNIDALPYLIDEIVLNQHNQRGHVIEQVSSRIYSSAFRPYIAVFTELLDIEYEEGLRVFAAHALGETVNHSYSAKTSSEDRMAIDALKKARRRKLPLREEYEHSKSVRRATKEALRKIINREECIGPVSDAYGKEHAGKLLRELI